MQIATIYIISMRVCELLPEAVRGDTSSICSISWCWPCEAWNSQVLATEQNVDGPSLAPKQGLSGNESDRCKPSGQDTADRRSSTIRQPRMISMTAANPSGTSNQAYCQGYKLQKCHFGVGIHLHPTIARFLCSQHSRRVCYRVRLLRRTRI
jgi:hypothetical protein